MNKWQKMEALLASLDARAMSLPELHGFLSAVIVSPDLIPPSMWLLFIFNDEGEQPAFESKDQAGVLDTVISYYNHVAESMDKEVYRLPGRTAEAGPKRDDVKKWAKGFSKGFSMWETELDPDTEDELHSLLLPIVYFINADDLAEDMDSEAERREFLSAAASREMIRVIPEAVLMIRNYFARQNPAQPPAGRVLPFEVRIDPKPGRNQPCPCGSGKKYKHCCGVRDDNV